MVVAKKIGLSLFFLFLVIYPFGQLTKWFDFVILFCALYAILQKDIEPEFLKELKVFLGVAAFSWILSLAVFKTTTVIIGSLYLIRLWGLIYFGLFIWNLVKEKIVNKDFVVNSLIIISFFTAIFGWVQYFFFTDMRPLIEYGWDDHLYRLVGTHLDPGFTGIILVMGLILLLLRSFEKREKKWGVLIFFFLVTIAFTYSRASYLALASALGVIFILKRKARVLLTILFGFLLLISLLPRPSSEGVQLERTKSISARLESYKDGLDIFRTSPLFGVGYNNICLAKRKLLDKGDFSSHSCSGFDSSLLIILASTGIVGLTVFVSELEKIRNLISRDFYGNTLIVSGIAVITHSLFVNSLIYPWVLSWLMILVALSTKE